MAINTCRICSHIWNSYKLKPVQCPRCKRCDWEKPLNIRKKSEVIKKDFNIEKENIDDNMGLME